MSYVAWSVVFGEQPSASKWNILGTNDASFNDGTGIGDNAIINRHIAEGVVALEKLNATIAFEVYLSTSSGALGSGFTLIDYNSLGTEVYDYGGDYNKALNKFVAPVDGIYHFDHVVQYTTNRTRTITTLYVNGNELYRGGEQGTVQGCSGSVNALLSAGDEVQHYVFDSTAGGVLEASGSPLIHQTAFSGYLVGEV